MIEAVRLPGQLLHLSRSLMQAEGRNSFMSPLMKSLFVCWEVFFYPNDQWGLKTKQGKKAIEKY